MPVRLSDTLWICLLIAMSGGAASQTVEGELPATRQRELAQDILSADWSKWNHFHLQRPLPGKDAIDAFYQQREDGVWTGSSHEGSWRVCSFGFYDLAGNADPKLIINYNASARDFCNQIIILGKSGPISYLDAWEPGSANGVEQAIRDLGHDGHLEIVLPDLWSEYSGAANCWATWLSIYRLSGPKFVDVSRNYPDIYRSREAALARILAALPNKRSPDEIIRNIAKAKSRILSVQPEQPGWRWRSMEITSNDVAAASDKDDLDKTCYTMEYDRIQRFLGKAPNAGLKEAEAWMQRRNPAFRLNAVAVLDNIRSRAAMADLRTLARTDPDQDVARIASQALKK